MRGIYILITVGFITLFGAFLRLYNFSDWLHFELDQARDVIFVSEAVQRGPGELPVLGPKASGTALQLGPAYYYMEYVSALVFGDTPQGHALFVAFLSIFSIPLFFLLMRRFFDIWVTLGLTLAYASSAFFVLYGRFGWNPNALPFFLLLGFLALLKATDEMSRYPGRWLVLSGVCVAIGTQLHFVSFVALPLAVTVYLILIRKKFSLRAWVFFVLAFAVIYTPVLVSEYVSHGANTKAFFSAVGKKKTDKNLLESATTSLLSQMEATALILDGRDNIFLPKYSFEGFSIKRICGDHCRKTPDAFVFLTEVFFIVGTTLLLFFFRDERKKPERILFVVWLLSLTMIFTLLADELPPRFFILLLPIPFIFLGFLTQYFGVVGRVLFAAVIVVLLLDNGRVLASRFDEMKRSGSERVRTSADHILEEPIRVTLSQERSIASFFFEKHRENGYPVFIHGDSFWRRSIKYLTERMGVPVGHLDPNVAFEKGNNFIVIRADKEGASMLRPYRERYDIGEKREFGTLAVYTLFSKKELAVTDEAAIIPLSELLSGDAGDRVASKTKNSIVPIAQSYDAGDIERRTWNDLLFRKK